MRAGQNCASFPCASFPLRPLGASSSNRWVPPTRAILFPNQGGVAKLVAAGRGHGSHVLVCDSGVQPACLYAVWVKYIDLAGASAHEHQPEKKSLEVAVKNTT